MEDFQLKLFASIARTRNFSRTAEEYFITQPAVTHQIKKLESQVGAKLIRRTSHEVSLTPEGYDFLPYAIQILELSSIAVNRVMNIAEGRVGRIRIATLSAMSHHVCESLIALHDKYPNIQVDIDILEGPEIIMSLQQQKHDFYFTGKPSVPQGSGYSSRLVCDGTLSLFVNKSIVDTIDFDDWSTIGKHPFVSVRKSDIILTNKVEEICRNRGCVPHIINYYNRAESVVLSVNAGIGVAILPSELGKLYQRPNVVTFLIEGYDAQNPLAFVWREDAESTAYYLFRDIVLSIFPGMPD